MKIIKKECKKHSPDRGKKVGTKVYIIVLGFVFKFSLEGKWILYTFNGTETRNYVHYSI
jgi:hypothetical protein